MQLNRPMKLCNVYESCSSQVLYQLSNQPSRQGAGESLVRSKMWGGHEARRRWIGLYENISYKRTKWVWGGILVVTLPWHADWKASHENIYIRSLDTMSTHFWRKLAEQKGRPKLLGGMLEGTSPLQYMWSLDPLLRKPAQLKGRPKLRNF